MYKQKSLGVEEDESDREKQKGIKEMREKTISRKREWKRERKIKTVGTTERLKKDFSNALISCCYISM